MFSVTARPFNSKARQLYGGWTVSEAQNARNLWALRKAMSMESKYGSNPQDLLAARRWLRDYKATYKSNPVGMRLAMNRARRALGFEPVRKRPLPKAQKDAILAYWRSIPLNDKSQLASLKRNLISKVPYPPYGYLIQHPHFAYPFQELDPAVMNFAVSADQMSVDPDWYFDTKEARKAFMARNPTLKPIRFDKAALGPIHPMDPSVYLGDLATVSTGDPEVALQQDLAAQAAAAQAARAAAQAQAAAAQAARQRVKDEDIDDRD